MRIHHLSREKLIFKDGNDVCIITMGLMVPIALKAAEMLEAEGISAAVVNMHISKTYRC